MIVDRDEFADRGDYVSRAAAVGGSCEGGSVACVSRPLADDQLAACMAQLSDPANGFADRLDAAASTAA
jgi:hypothetical protein